MPGSARGAARRRRDFLPPPLPALRGERVGVRGCLPKFDRRECTDRLIRGATRWTRGLLPPSLGELPRTNRRFVPRNDAKHDSTFPRRDAPEVCSKNLRALKIRGRGECRMHAAPAVSCAKREENAHEHTGQRRQSDIPCAVALRLISRSPRRSGFFDTVAREYGRQRPVGMTGLRGLDANH